MSRPAAAPEPVDEPVLVECEGRTEVISPENPAWWIAWAWREQKVANELLERDLRTKRAQIRKLQDDQDAKRKTYGKRAVIEELFQMWQKLRHHPRSKLTAERFDAARGRLEEEYSELDLQMALHGQNAHPAAKGGVVFDDFELVFRSGKNVERYANLCPAEKRRELRMAAAQAAGEQGELPLPGSGMRDEESPL